MDPGSYLTASAAYADIFDYPLTVEELGLWCVKKNNKHLQIPPNLIRQGAYVYLKGRKNIVSQRSKRFSASKEKWRIARRAGWWLRLIPMIRLVGVTGGLAMNNAGAGDDIDLFIITQKNTVWTTRLFSTFIVDLLGIRRKPGETDVADKVCLNMFESEDALTIPKKEQDLFSAHEVLQMQPLWEKGDTYAKFLTKNKWVMKILPNAWIHKHKAQSTKHKIHSKSKNTNIWNFVLQIYFEFWIWCLRFLERPARAVQLWYMKRHRTTEVVTDRVLRFHPRDARVWVKTALQKRLAPLNIPLDNVFYAG